MSPQCLMESIVKSESDDWLTGGIVGGIWEGMFRKKKVQALLNLALDDKLDLVTGALINSTNTKASQVKITTKEPDRSKELPSNRSDIDEIALYEHAAEKQNNQSERAFIYINQKYKKPSLHHYFRLAQNGPELSRSFHSPPPLSHAYIKRRNEPRKSETEYLNSYNDGNNRHNLPNRSPDIPSYFLTPSLKKKSQVKEISNPKRIGYNEQLLNYNRQNNIRHDFIELLKSPLLRISDGVEVNVKYDGISGLRFTTTNPKHTPFRIPIIPKHNSKANILVDERKSDTLNNYGFSSYVHHPVYQSKGILQRIEDPSFEGHLLINDSPSQFLEKQQYEDKLLDEYIKNTLGEQVTSNEKEILRNQCCYPDCIIQSTKTSSSITHQKDTKKQECSCGRPVQSPDKNVLRFKKRPERRHKPFNKTFNTLMRPSLDFAFFKEIYSQNSKSKILNDRLILSTIKKLNSTVYD